MARSGWSALLCASVAVMPAPAGAGDAPRTLGPFGAEVRVAFAPDGKSIGVTMRGGSASRLELASGRRLARYEGEAEESESAVAFSPDGSRFALATLEGRVRVFDAKSGAVVATFDHGGPVHTLAFTSDGKAIVTGGGLPQGVQGEGASAPAPERPAEPEAEGQEQGEPEGAGSDALADGPTARVWDATSGEKVVDLDLKTKNPASGVAASPAGSMVAVARHDGKLGLFELSAKKRLEVELGAPSHVAAFSPDGKLVAVMGGKDGALVSLVDVAKGEVVRTIGGAGPAGPDGALAFSPDGKLLARTAPGVAGVQLFAVESGALERTLEQGQAAKGSLAFSPDGKTLASGLRSGQVVLHDLAADKK